MPIAHKILAARRSRVPMFSLFGLPIIAPQLFTFGGEFRMPESHPVPVFNGPGPAWGIPVCSMTGERSPKLTYEQDQAFC